MNKTYPGTVAESLATEGSMFNGDIREWAAIRERAYRQFRYGTPIARQVRNDEHYRETFGNESEQRS